jgi:hypothetical protein
MLKRYWTLLWNMWNQLWDMGTPGSPLTKLTVVPDKWVRPTRRPADLSVDLTDLVGGPHDLMKTFQKIPQMTWSATTSRLGVQDKDLGGFRLQQFDGIWQDVQSRLRSPGRNWPGVGEPTSSASQYKADEATLCNTRPSRNPQAIYTDNWT